MTEIQRILTNRRATLRAPDNALSLAIQVYTNPFLSGILIKRSLSQGLAEIGYGRPIPCHKSREAPGIGVEPRFGKTSARRRSQSSLRRTAAENVFSFQWPSHGAGVGFSPP